MFWYILKLLILLLLRTFQLPFELSFLRGLILV